MNDIKLLSQIFQLKKPIIFEDIESGNSVVSHKDKTIIKCDQTIFDRFLPEAIAYAKLAETDHLLILGEHQFIEQDNNYNRVFIELCRPLMRAWAWKTMRKFAPNIYDEEILKVAAFKPSEDPLLRTLEKIEIISIYIENPSNTTVINFKGEQVNPIFYNQINLIKHFSRQEPNADIYLNFPAVLGNLFSTTIENLKGERFYRIKENI